MKQLIQWGLSLLCGCLLFTSVTPLVVWDISKDQRVIEQITTHPQVLSQIRSIIINAAAIALKPGVFFDLKVLTGLNEQVLPDSEISLMLQSNWQTFFNWLEQPSLDLPEIRWELSRIKEFFRSPEGKVALLTILRALPPCPSASGTSDVQLQAQSCLPKDANLLVLVEQYGQILQLAFPDQITLEMLVDQGTIPPDTLSILKQIKPRLFQIRQMTLIGLAIAVFLLSILIVIAPTDDSNRLKVLQLPFLITSLLSLSTLIGFYGLLSALSQQIDLPSQLNFFKPIVRIFGLELSRRWLIVTAFWGGCYGLSVIATLGWQRFQRVNQTSPKPSASRRSRLRKEFR